MVLRMAGGEDDPTALRGVGGQIADFRERRRGRLFQQDVLAGVDRLALACLAGEYAAIVDADMTVAAARLAKTRLRSKETPAEAGD